MFRGGVADDGSFEFYLFLSFYFEFYFRRNDDRGNGILNSS